MSTRLQGNYGSRLVEGASEGRGGGWVAVRLLAPLRLPRVGAIPCPGAPLCARPRPRPRPALRPRLGSGARGGATSGGEMLPAGMATQGTGLLRPPRPPVPCVRLEHAPSRALLAGSIASASKLALRAAWLVLAAVDGQALLLLSAPNDTALRNSGPCPGFISSGSVDCPCNCFKSR